MTLGAPTVSLQIEKEKGGAGRFCKINTKLEFSYAVFVWCVGHNIKERSGDVCCLC